MSIDFGTDIYEEPLVSKSFLPEDSGELSLRPHTLREYIGQQKAKENLSVFIEAARRRTEPLDHVLLHGPPGLGKTTLAGIIAAEMGVNIRITSGPAIEKPGDLAALLTIVIWGTTFISTKVLLVDFQPVEILFIRFMMGFLALLAVCPRRLQGVTRRQEGLFALAGLCGVCLYYLLENIALTYTMASNVGVIISVSPCFTALLTHFLMRGEERLRPTFFAGFAVAMAGICLISFNGSALELDLRGDLLALLAAFVWACYALLSRKISALGHPTVLTTRRTFFYGLAFMLPALMVSGVRLELTRLTAPVNLGNLLFLGLGASALCFVTWNFAVKALGAVKTSVYIYLVPVITVAASVLILREPFTWMTGAGTVLTLIGLLLSEGKLHWKEGTHHETGTGQMRPGD